MSLNTLIKHLEDDLGTHTTITPISTGMGCHSLSISNPSHDSYWEIDELRKSITLERQEIPSAQVGTHILPWMKRFGYRLVGVTPEDLAASEQPRYMWGPQGTRHRDFADVLPLNATMILTQYIPHKEWGLALQDVVGEPVMIGRLQEEDKRVLLLSPNTVVGQSDIFFSIVARAEKLARDEQWTNIAYEESLGCITRPSQ